MNIIMKKLFGLIVLFFALTSNVLAQIDTEFWFAAPDLYGGHAEQPIRFCISSFDSPATVVFEQPANSSYTPMTFNLNANSFHVYDVSNIIYMVETQPYNTVLNYGFHIYSTAPISVYYESYNNNSEIYSLKGNNALGTNFIVCSQYTFPNYYSLHSRTEVLATQDATEITFLPSVPVKDGQPSGVPITITLNRGQCYALEAQGYSGSDHIRNTIITSNKPIAVNTSDDSVDFQYSAQDLIGDQIVPISLLGTDYCALWNNTSNEYLYFFPTQDDTHIYLNGSQTPVATLDVGQEYGYQLNTSAVYVHSDNPIAVFQLASDQSGEFGGTVLPHINCTGSRKVIYKRNGTMDITITLVVKSSCVNNFLLNGNASWLTSSDFNVVPSNAEYSYCKKDVSQYVPIDGLITVENTNEDGYFQMGVLSRGGDYGTCSYGYFSDYHEYAYAEFNMDDTFCAGDNITFSFEAENVENLTLILPNGTTMTQQPFVLTNVQTSQSGTYQLQGESCNGIQILDEIYINIEDCVIPENPLPDNVMDFDCVLPANPNAFEMVELFSCPNVNSMSTPIIADLDGDGLPEIIACSYSSSAPWFSSGFHVFNGQTGTLKYTIATAQYYNHGQSMTIADVNHDGLAEIFLLARDNHIYCYSHTGDNLWTSSNTIDHRFILQTADINNDGNAELVCGCYVYNAITGTLLLQGNMVNSGMGFGSPHGVNSYYHPPYYLFALGDINGNNTLELCAGNTVYKMTINNPNGTTGNQWTILRQSSTMEGIVNYDGQTFLVDFDNDGDLDICVIGVTHDLEYSSYYTINVYVWDGQTSNIIAQKELFVNNNWGASIPYSGDLNGDGSPEIIFSVPEIGMMAYTYNPSFPSNMQLLHQHEPFGETSGFTVFDFNQDGQNEIVYRGTSELFIVDGSTLENLCTPITAYSGTVTEYPVIADVNADGHAEIIVTRAYNAWNGYNAEGWVTVYGSQIPGAWSSARKVWNQWAYNSVNINEDLTVPQFMFNISTYFPNGDQPFNAFLHQMPYIDSQGNLFNIAPDVAALSANVTTGGGNATLNVTYTNQGDNTLNAPYYITIFANQFGGQVLQTITVNTSLPVGNTGQQNITLPMSDLCQMENLTSLVVVINCNGGGIAQNGDLQPECDITNNMAQVSINLQSDPTTITETACDQYAWYGQTYTQSGQYETIIQNSYGCDSTLVLNLTVNHSDTTYLDIEACENYLWYGTTYNQSGTYQHLLQTAAGCDSLLVLNLNIGEAYNSIENIDACDSYYWSVNQQWYYQSALDSMVIQGQQGVCDSTFVLNLTIHYTDTVTVAETACDQFEWNGTQYTQSGEFEFNFTNSHGCDSIVYFNLTINHSDTINYNITACESYEWNGQTYSQSGNYTYNTTNEFGCAHLETLALTISDSYRQEDVVSECDSYLWPVTQQWYYQSTLDSIVIQGSQGACDSTFVLNLVLHYSDTLDLQPVTACDAYEWHGVTYTESGLLTYQTTNEYGCSRLERLDLTISESETIDLPPITECDQYIWHGLAYTESGTYTFDTLNQYGCPMQYILPLTINHSDTLDWDPVTACDLYIWYGLTITETGDYAHMSITPEGCDRLERIHITINYNTFDTIAPITACDNYVWHETTYTQSGVYSYETQDPGGCLHTEILFLTVNHSSQNEFSVTSCEPYEWYGIVYDEPGTYTHTLTNSQGCDSLLIMHLDIGETFIMEENAIGCDEYMWHGTLYTQGGNYQYEATNPDGCDSIFILHLTIAPTYEMDETAESCYSYVWVNEVLTQSGDYERHFNSVMGCDSLVTLHLTINEAVHHEFEQETCLPTFTWNGITYYVNGDYEQTLTANNGCDSIVIMHLHFNEQFNTDITVNTCEEVYTWNGTDYYETGVYHQSFLSSAGCDSIVNLHLNIADVFTINIDTISCGAFYWEGVPLNSGTYQYQYLTAMGCDSIVNLHLDVVDAYEVSIDTTACGSYKWGDEWLTTSGDYQSQFVTSNGCDSIVNLHLTVRIIPTCAIQGPVSIFPATDMISGVYPYYLDSTGINPAHVHWSIDRDDWLLVSHSASCDLFCLSIGQGILHAWTEDEPCNIDTTLVLNATFFDVGENGQASLKLYPNPTKGKITVEWDEIKVINVYDLLGQKLMACEYGKEQVCVLDLSRFQHSVYVLEVVSSAGRIIKPVVLTQ